MRAEACLINTWGRVTLEASQRERIEKGREGLGRTLQVHKKSLKAEVETSCVEDATEGFQLAGAAKKEAVNVRAAEHEICEEKNLACHQLTIKAMGPVSHPTTHLPSLHH